MNRTYLTELGLKWNPFSSELPAEALYCPPKLTEFAWRIENTLVREGGFALIQGDPGAGKSVALRQLAARLQLQPDVKVGVISHPQSSLGDFYRELGEIFDVSLRPTNRWGGFKLLRERWAQHLGSTRHRCVLLIDEAQEMMAKTLLELRLMSSAEFDSKALLAVILVGDGRLLTSLRTDELLPLGSRIRYRLNLEYASLEELKACMGHLLDGAGNPALMTPGLQQTLAEHAGGNYRTMINLANNLLGLAALRKLHQLDDKLYLEAYGATPPAPSRRAARA
jgi:general secretion pathway protein A